MNHNQLTGKFAVHPFAFVGATDPAADAANGVTANKAWIDTSGTPTLKIRNSGNTAWLTIIGGSGAAAFFIQFSTPVGLYLEAQAIKIVTIVTV